MPEVDLLLKLKLVNPRSLFLCPYAMVLATLPCQNVDLLSGLAVLPQALLKCQSQTQSEVSILIQLKMKLTETTMF